MFVIDANALVLLIIGLMDPSLISSHKRTSIYEKQDFDDLIFIIEKIENLIILPNVWTEVDNLLNNFTGGRKLYYIDIISKVIDTVPEQYLPTSDATNDSAFLDLGITDTLLLQVAKKFHFLITGDSQLSDYAIAHGIDVHDIVKNRNMRFK